MNEYLRYFIFIFIGNLFKYQACWRKKLASNDQRFYLQNDEGYFQYTFVGLVNRGTYVIVAEIGMIFLQSVVKYRDHDAVPRNSFGPGLLHVHVQSIPPVLERVTINLNCNFNLNFNHIFNFNFNLNYIFNFNFSYIFGYIFNFNFIRRRKMYSTLKL